MENGRKARRSRAKAWEIRKAEINAEGARIVASGVCPVCGSGLHRNLSFAGWWQCNRSGSGSFRIDKSGDHCDFDCFTE